MIRSWTKYHGTEIVDQGEYDVEWEDVRRERNAALSRSDWRAGKDVVLSTAWRDFRQALRDLPQDNDSANDAADNWPVMPDE
jgi:hypothetical protein